VTARVLVLSPHPDDDAIGCGGTLCQHVANGDSIKLVVLTSGEAGGHRKQDECETIRLREAEAIAASKIIGIQHVEFWRQPDGKLQPSLPLVRRLKEVIEAWQPATIYAPHPAEMHVDHQATTELLRLATLELKQDAPPIQMRLYEVWTPIQKLDVIVDISDYVHQKVAAIREHRTQIEAMRLDDAAIALNRFRGEMHSWPGGDYAEVFERLRK
jgi:N-acetylglucosamine malate deacetylase 1